jgi:phage baseplate assembly protein W
MADDFVPRFSVPMDFDVSGRTLAVAQDTDSHTLMMAKAVALCPLGFRQEKPDFGWDVPEFRPVPLRQAAQGLASAIARWVPGVSLRANELRAVAADAAARVIEIDIGAPDA